MKTSTRFIVIFMIGVLVSIPIVNGIQNILLKHEIKRALAHFIREHCQEEITIAKVDFPVYEPVYIMSFSVLWKAESEIGTFGGEVYKRRERIMLDDIPCTERNPVNKNYVLDRQRDIFVATRNSFRYSYEPPPRGLYYLIVVAIGVVIWVFLMYIEEKKKR